jgi:hypothetical protein
MAMKNPIVESPWNFVGACVCSAFFYCLFFIFTGLVAAASLCAAMLCLLVPIVGWMILFWSVPFAVFGFALYIKQGFDACNLPFKWFLPNPVK